MPTRGPAALGLALVTVLALGGCGAGSPADPTTTGPDPDTERPAVAVEVVRSGGIAGVRDTLRIAPDGTARLTTRDGSTSRCRPGGEALGRLRGIDLATVAPEPSPGTVVADGFSYAVRVGDARASASDGDEGRRADLVDAAAAVLTSCLTRQSGSAGY